MKRDFHRGLFTNATIKLNKNNYNYTKTRKSRSCYCTICNNHLCSDAGVYGRKSIKKINKGKKEKVLRQILNDY